MIRIALPFPPSVNALFANARKGRVKTPAYKDWIQLASLQIKESHRQNLGHYHLHIALRRPDARRRDLGNLEKAVSDFLVTMGVIQDDGLCERLTLVWDSTLDADCVIIVQEAWEALAA